MAVFEATRQVSNLFQDLWNKFLFFPKGYKDYQKGIIGSENALFIMRIWTFHHASNLSKADLFVKHISLSQIFWDNNIFLMFWWPLVDIFYEVIRHPLSNVQLNTHS